MNNSQKNWLIAYLMPNLQICHSFENDKIAIVMDKDLRVQTICTSNKYWKHLVNNFEDQFRKKVKPGLLLIREDATSNICEEAIIGFRNIFAISCIVKAHEHSMTSTLCINTLYSDNFDFYPISVGKNNDCFITSSPDILKYDDEYRKFRGQTSPNLASSPFRFADPDKQLISLLKKSWNRHYIKKGSQGWKMTSLFRSLEIAYQASMLPFKNQSTIYDFGSSASLWVSALEVLSHPRNGHANLDKVLSLLGKYDWKNKDLKAKRYKVVFRRKISRVNLVQKLYKELYDTRNDFLHGNPVRLSRLFPFNNKNVPYITRFAPLIYKVGLLSYLGTYEINGKNDSSRQYILKLINERGLSEAILKSRCNL